MSEYWTALRHLTPTKIKAVKAFLVKNKMEILDSELMPDDAWVPDGQRYFNLRFASQVEASYFRYVFEVTQKPDVPYDYDTFGNHPWRTEKLFQKKPSQRFRLAPPTEQGAYA